ncbi:MAG: type II toxin-antitoxin system VapC family toxin [Methanosarcinales archaeon]
MIIYLDTSSLVKRYCEEEGSEVINALFESAHGLVTSVWTIVETVAAIDKKVAKRQITEEERDFALETFFSDLSNRRIILIRFYDEFTPLIISLVLKHHISADDALQLLSAITCSPQVFLASDKKLLESADKENLRALNPEKEEDAQELLRIFKVSHN